MKNTIKTLTSAATYFAILSAVKSETLTTKKLMSMVYERLDMSAGDDAVIDAIATEIFAGCLDAIDQSASDVEEHIDDVISESDKMRKYS